MNTSFPTLEQVSGVTPHAWYDVDGLSDRVQWAAQKSRERGWILAYSVKSNPSPQVLRRVAAAGLAAEAISGAEVDAAVRAGINLSDVVLAGPAKAWPWGTVPGGLLAIVDETLPAFLAQANPECGHRYHCLRLRYPGINSRLGIDTADWRLREELSRSLQEASRRGVSVGLATHAHVVTRPALSQWISGLVHMIRAVTSADPGLDSYVECLDVGGGFDKDALDELLAGSAGDFLCARVAEHLPACQQIVLEPGKSLVEGFGVLVASVLDIGPGDRLIVDASIAELPWPRQDRPVYRWREGEWRLLESGPATIYGRTTAESDVLRVGLDLGGLALGDLLLFGEAGAYDVSMRSVFARGFTLNDDGL